MPKTDVYNDLEVRAFIDGQDRHATYTEMAEACLERFGAERAWSRSKIIRYWQSSRPIIKGRPQRVDEDPDVRTFVEDRLGRLTLDEIVALCREAFGGRAPSRSAIHRYWQRTRGSGKRS